MSGFYDFFEASHWKVVDVLTTEPRKSELFPVDDLALAPASRAYLNAHYPAGVYRHQLEALKHYLAGENVGLVTGTASGKSLVFQAAALDLLARDPQARVMAIYPMKALGNEQQDRWQSTLQAAGLNGQIGRIDGNVPPGFRLGVLERSQVIVFTPDIIHAWLFSNLNQPAVIQYLRQVRLIVVDEVHAYSGVFGSNTAFLFRRIQHILHLLGARPAYICASATIARPEEHLNKLLGLDFRLVGPEYDTSPRYPLRVTLAEPPGADRFLDEVVRLLEYLTQHTASRFIAFVDSRKQVELISSILNRLLREDQSKTAEGEGEGAEGAPARKGRGASRGRVRNAAPEPEEEDPAGEVTGVLQNLNVLPYRAGYEDHDRRQIQERLADGTLNGVVSTSALELGLDIPHLDTCILIGVPGSATSLQQRIGRIGRHGPGDVIVVNGGDLHDQMVFASPKSFFDRPLAESALYLENEHIQYIHALCLARQGGEHDQVAAAQRKPDAAFHSPVRWPARFNELCQMERAGTPPRHLLSLKLEGRDRPNYTFPLRDVESQFKVERRDGPNVSSLGSLSFGQLMREAYPGAIYYYATVPYRVTRVNAKSKTVQVRREKRYTTQPQRTPPAVFPRLTTEGVNSMARHADLTLIECSLLVRESIRGVIEQRGRNESHYPYPLARELGFYQDQPYFSRNYFTTGVILTSPVLSEPGVFLEGLAGFLYEAFMLMIPFERQDIGAAADRFRVNLAPVIAEGSAFLTIFDQTYGSLRLSGRLLNPAILGKTLIEAVILAGKARASVANLTALAAMAAAVLRAPRQALGFAKQPAGASQPARDPALWERVVLPGSKGLMVRTNEEFLVDRVLATPAGLSYEGTPVSMVGSGMSVMPLLGDVAEIPGESRVGWYEIATGKIEPVEAEAGAAVVPVDAPAPPPALEPEWVQARVVPNLNGGAIARLAQCLGRAAPPADRRLEWAAELLAEEPLPGLLEAMLAAYAEETTPPPEEDQEKTA